MHRIFRQDSNKPENLAHLGDCRRRGTSAGDHRWTGTAALKTRLPCMKDIRKRPTSVKGDVLTIGFSTTAGVKMGDKTAPVRFLEGSGEG